MNILVITPQFPYPPTGACEQDRLAGFNVCKEMGHRVTVLSKISGEKQEEAQKHVHSLGLDGVHLIPYQKKKKVLPRILNPLYLDGAAYEYADSVLQERLIEILDTKNIDVVWCEYTYLWPVYKEIKKRGIPIIVRSINVEPLHFLEEDGSSPLNWLKARIKWCSEYLSVRGAQFVCAITPKEEKIYERMGAVAHITLPLRALHTMIGTHIPKDKKILSVVFMGSTYKVAHNRRAAEMVITEIAPLLEEQFPGAFNIHITGGKLPEALQNKLPKNVVYEGYVDNLSQFLENMDIAIAPSLFGQGMQQKVFEPIVRGIPTIATTRAIAEYALSAEEHYMPATTAQEFVSQLGQLASYAERCRISKAAIIQSTLLFNKQHIVTSIKKALETATLHV